MQIADGSRGHSRERASIRPWALFGGRRPVASSAQGARRGAGLRLGCLALVLGMPLIYYGVQLAARTMPLAAAQVVAHRGGSKYAPENTLAAFRTAIAQGADGLEFDVQMSRDGALVIMHDETIDRTTNGTGAVRDFTLGQLRTFDAGNGEKIPTFEEVLQLAKASNIAVFPEAKSPHLYPGLEAKMVAALQAADYVDHAIVVDFEPASLETLHRLDPALRLCALYGTGQFDVSAPAGEAQFICPEAEMVLLDPGIIRQAHAEGRQVFVWFLALEDPFMIRTMRTFGADGFISNDPAAAKATLTGP